MKHIPERTCIVCRNKFPKTSVMRIVRNENGLEVDQSGCKDGRGAYLCGNMKCLHKFKKSHCLDRVFKQKVDDNVYDTILKYFEENCLKADS